MLVQAMGGSHVDPVPSPRFPSASKHSHCAPGRKAFAFSLTCGLAALLAGAPASAQVTIDSSGRVADSNSPNSVDRRFAQIEPTKVELPTATMDAKTRLEVIRIMQAEQGFAMRPFPKGHKGLTLVANGKLDPAGEPYLEMITKAGTSAKPGDRLVLTDVKIDNDKIVFDINGGPDHKHGFLRHIQIGTGPQMSPVVQDDDQEPQGCRLTLDFKGHVPELTGLAGEGAAGPADLVRREDSHPGLHRYASAQAQGCHSESPRDGGHEHGDGDVRHGAAGEEDPRDGRPDAV